MVPLVVVADCTRVRATIRTVGLKTSSCVTGPLGPRRLLNGVGSIVGARANSITSTARLRHPTHSTGHPRPSKKAHDRCIRKRDRTTHRLCRRMHLITPASVSILVANSDNAKGRCITHHVRRRDGHGGTPFVTISYKTVPGSLTTSRFFKRIGNSFAKTVSGGRNTFITTRNNAVFLSRVNGLSCRMRMRLLHTLRRQGMGPVNDGRRVTVGIHLISTAGRGLHSTVSGKSFHRSLCRHVGRFAIHVPSLGRQGRSLLLFTGGFLSRTGVRLRGSVVNFSGSIVQVFRSCS